MVTLTKEQFLSLKKKAISHNVKRLMPEVREYIDSHSDQGTLMARTIDVLLQHNLLEWPLSQDDYNLVVERYNSQEIIPRYLQLIVFQCWETNIPDFDRLSDKKKIWHYVHDVREIPKCTMCGKDTRWSRRQNRYTRHCSNVCRAKDPGVAAKRAATCMERNGHTGLFTNKECKQKCKDTLQKRLGVDYPFQNKEIQQEAVRIVRERYGDDMKSLREKAASTRKEKYGTESFGQAFKGPEFREKAQITRLKRWLPKRIEAFKHIVIPLFKLDQFEDRFQMLPYKCVKCTTEFEDCLRDGHVPRCPICFPLNRVNWNQNTLVDFCKSFDTEIIESDRTTIHPLELDIVIPEKAIAIEYNGLYWHSDVGSNGRVDKDYHLNKTRLCQEQDIQLLHVFEDEWMTKREIVQSIIRAKINRVETKIQARKCTIRKVDYRTAADFLNDNHIQGEDKSKIQYGLFYNEEMVAIMTFGKPRFNAGHQWELIRYCSKINVGVIGGAGKLLKHFIRKHQPLTMVTYADLRYSNGNLYEKLGFIREGVTPPNYFYVNIDEACTMRYSRISFQKHKLKKKLKSFNPDLTEVENMKVNNYARVWDCGSIRFTKTF